MGRARSFTLLAVALIASLGSVWIATGRGTAPMGPHGLECGSPQWSETVNELNGAPSPWHTEESALLAEWDSSVDGRLPVAARRITTDPAGDGFLETARSRGEAEFVLLRDGTIVARAHVVAVEAGGYAVSGVTACVD
jgi:hypothetical protein